MTDDQYRVLQALYQREEGLLQGAQYDIWATPAEVASALPPNDPHHGDSAWVRQRLEELWTARKVLQVTDEAETPTQLVQVTLSGLDVHGANESRLAVETTDCRRSPNTPIPPGEEVAIYGPKTQVRYRSRVAEIARLLSWNYQRFNMAPATGLLRYVRRRQERPVYDVLLNALSVGLQADILAGHIQAEGTSGGVQTFPLATSINRPQLASAVAAVLEELAAQFIAESRAPNLASFQARSLAATLAGLYCPGYRAHTDAHVVTAGVGSGKTFAFQLGALVHVAYRALIGERKIQVLLVYPRVVLAANQFQDLIDLIGRVSARLGLTSPLLPPLLDAGGQLPQQMGRPEMEVGRLFKAIVQAYQGSYQILISNLDTLARRLSHPEAFRWLAQNLDLIVLDEIHILSGLYGAHARMLLRRLLLIREICRLRDTDPPATFTTLLGRRDPKNRPYFIGASATISEPREHTGRILSLHPDRVQHLVVGQTQQTGWVHHFFIRQRPEVSSMSAVTNATSCLIHNRRDGLFREYYQRTAPPNTNRIPLALTDLANPVQPAPTPPAVGVELRDPVHIHKTIGFCDSLDGVGRWATLIGDNERTKAAKMGTSPNPSHGELPYFLRFQEPLWRVVHHLSFGGTIPPWQQQLWAHYGQLCLDCKRGCKRHIDRIPSGLTAPQRARVERLWALTDANEDSYLQQLGVPPEFVGADWFQPVHDAAQQSQIGNLDECGFFRTGLCWWWSMDHMGSNHPRPVSPTGPLNGLKRPRAHPRNIYNFVNAIRLRSFSSVTYFDAFDGDSINDLFRASARTVFRDAEFAQNAVENCALLIGSPRIEVGIDLDRASEGITFRALRDPASVQQKAGRVGREQRSDSVVLHLVTDNTRDHFYFRNPRIALDPEYLQPIPLHASNQIVARNHYFMAIVDFICVQGLNSGAETLPANGSRLALINDHAQNPPFQNWNQKVSAVYQFLFGTHPRQAQNLANLHVYLQALGASATEITNPASLALGPADAPRSLDAGAVDVFRHEFGPNLLLTPLPYLNRSITLADLCATEIPPPAGFQAPTHLRRHQAFLDTYQTYHTPEGQAPNARRDRGYLANVLTLPLFRRGLPQHNQPGNQPYLWTPALFEAVGNESVRVFEELHGGGHRSHDFERVGLALALLVPGTYTYRYTVSARKVPVARFGAQGLTNLLPRVEGVNLLVHDPDYYQPAGCPVLLEDNLPADFVGLAPGIQVPVYTPQQIGLIWVPEEPSVTVDGLVADNDPTPVALGIHDLPQPPRTFPLRWYRVTCSTNISDIPCRFQQRYSSPTGQPPLPRLPWPEVCTLFSSVQYDPAMEVTDFVWGLDQQFTTRQVDAARLVYREGGDGGTLAPVALGRHFQTPGIRFTFDFTPGSGLDRFLNDVGLQTHSGLYQAVLTQVLYTFLEEYARNPVPAGMPFWVGGSQPSVFVVRNLKSIVVFHLLERWHPQPSAGTGPAGPPIFTLQDVQGCFTPGHPNFLTEDRFSQVCQWLAGVQNPAAADARFDTLFATYANYQSATAENAQLNANFFKTVTRDLLLNTLSVCIHAAGLRLSGAEESDLAYFYRELPNGTAIVDLFDTDEFGNGTTDVIRDAFYISPAERILAARRRALGDNPDPIPSIDFVHCLEEQLHECPSSQAAHLAYHDLPAAGPALADLDGPRQGERQVAGPLFDFLRQRLACTSFDHTAFIQACPEFLSYLGGYPHHGGAGLVPSPTFPSFQALESGAGYCLHGCINCVVAPEQNIHGILTAKETVNKLLLDACYRRVVCERGTPRSTVTYPATGPGRSVAWPQLASVVASAIGQGAGAAMVVALPHPTGVQVHVIPSAVPAGWERLFRTGWGWCPPPSVLMRARMSV